MERVRQLPPLLPVVSCSGFDRINMQDKLNPQKRLKTPCMIQMENTDCGAVALGIVLAYYGCFVPMDELRTQCGVSRDGTSAMNLIKAALVYGLNGSIHHHAPNELPLTAYPILLFWRNRHFVVLEGHKGNAVFLNCPKMGRHTLQRATFNEHFSGSSIQFTRTEQFKIRKKERPLRTLFHTLRQGTEASWFFIILISVLLTAPTLAIPMFSKVFIDRYIIHDQTDGLPLFFGAMVLVLGLQTLCNFFQQKTLRHIECKYTQKLTRTLVHHLLSLPMLFFASRKVANLSLRPQATQSLAMTLTGPIFATLSVALQLLVYLGGMLFLNPLLSSITSFFAGCQLLCLLLKTEDKKQSESLVHQQTHELTSITAGYIASVSQIKAMGSEQAFFSKWQESLHQYLNTYQRLANTHATTQSIRFILSMTAHAITLSLGAWLVSQSKMTLGELMAFSVIFFSFNQSILQFIKFGNPFHLAAINCQQMTDITQHKAPVVPETHHPLPTTFRGKIEIIDLTFGYSPFDKPLFNKLNLTIEPQSNTAIIGASGSGKTTLVNLIAGLYQPWSGQILVDGVPISSLSPNIRAQLIGVVSQDQFFFKGSIKENICLWETHYSADKIMAAVRAACLDEFIAQLDDGLDFQLTEGASNLSGGQRQRLELARTLLIKPKVLLLDEATNTLDPLVEQQIDNHIQQLNATVITIAHRFNTICKARHIFILKQGEIVASGTHQSLMAEENRAYFELFNLSLSPRGVVQ